MKKHITHAKLGVLISIEFFKRNKAALILGLLSVVLIVFAEYKYKLFFNQNAISIGLIGTYQEHDLPIEVTRFLSQGLVEIDDSGRARPKLVTGWETNNDATSFKFKLKDNLEWIDKTQIKSNDLDFIIPNIEINYPDDKTIKLNLKEPYSPLPSLLTKPIFKKNTLIGTGPYRITKIEKSRIFITKIVTILFQNKDSQLSNRSLRQALSFITPKIESEELADNPYPHSLWAYNPDSKKYLANPEEAKAAMERAEANLSDELLKKDLILTTTPNLEEVGTKVVNSWKELGLNTKLRIESGIAQNFQALLITQSIPSDPDQYFLWHATQEKTNLTKYDSKRADKDLEDGRKIISEEDRKAKYFDFQKTLLEDAPAVFLYFPKYNIIYLKKAEKNLEKILSI